MEANPPSVKSLRKSKFDGKDLRSQDLRGADLTGSSFANADLSGMDLTGAILNKANLRDAKLAGATLSKVIAREVQARGTWENVTAEGADFTGLQGRKLEFNGCTFIKSNFSRANLRRVVFRNCTIDECDFSEATAPDISLVDSKISNSKFVSGDLSCPTIKNTTITRCAFNHSDLSGAVVANASITGSDLTKADFIAGEFENFKLEDNVLTKANFRYARGLGESATAHMREAGAKASRGWTRKATKAVFGTWPGRLAFLAVAALVVYIVVSHKLNPEYWPFDRLMQTAQVKREARDFALALRYCDIMKHKYCDDKIRCAMIKGELARTYLAWGKTDEAVKYFNEVLQYDTVDAPQQFDIQLEIIRALAIGKKYDEAIARIAKLFEKPEAITRLDTILSQLASIADDKQYQTRLLDLAERFRQTISDQTMLQQVDFTRAQLLDRLGKSDEALKILQDLVASGTAPDRVVRQALINSAEIYMRMSRSDLAAQVYAQLHTRFPDQSQDLMFARVNEAQILAGQSKFDEAEKILREVMVQAVDDLPRNSAKIALATLFIRQRKYDDARKLLENMMRDLPDTDRQHNEAQILLATTYREQDKLKEAVALLEPILNRDIDGNILAMARRELINCYRMMNRLDDAIKLIKTEIARDSDTNQRQFDLQTYADLLIANHDLAGGLAALDQAGQIAQDTESRIRLEQRICEILKNVGRLDEAAGRLKKIAESTGSDIQTRLWATIELVEIYRKRNQFAQANQLLSQIAEMSLQPGQIPSNMMSITWSTDAEGNRLTEAILQHVVKIEPATTFVGAAGRLALASKLIEVPSGVPATQDPPDLPQRMQQAEQLCREVIAQNQDVNQLFQSYETLSRIYQRRGDFDAAMAAFSEFENKFKYPRVKALAMLGRASTMLARNKRDEALAYYRQAMEACNEPMDCCRITCERAQQLVTAGRREEVRQVYLTVRNTLPNCWCHDEAVRFLQQQ